jgi:hypothetical protein
VRLASEVDGFPYNARAVCWVLVAPDGTVSSPGHTMAGRRAALAQVEAGGVRLFIAWPGQWRTDLFEVDDLGALRAAFA